MKTNFDKKFVPIFRSDQTQLKKI